MEEESTLDLLLLQIREAEAQRHAAEEELNRTPGWRLRERARLRRQFERCLAAKQRAVAFAAEVGPLIVHRQSMNDERPSHPNA